MSALYVLVLALLWLGVGALTRRLWSAYFVPERGISRRVRIFGGWGLLLLWLFVPVYLLYGRTALLDAEVRELCAKDGGVRVYETVRLPAIEYDKYASRNWILPQEKDATPSDKYFVELTVHYYREGNPEMSRRQYRTIRRNDKKVLGELVLYGRGGGDLPGPWHGSSFTCPTPAKLPNIESSIFIKEE